jgi:hypothetical protein
MVRSAIMKLCTLCAEKSNHLARYPCFISIVSDCANGPRRARCLHDNSISRQPVMLSTSRTQIGVLLMTMGDDVMLITESKRAISFHVDDIMYFAFFGHEDRLDGPDKPVAR